MAAACVGGRGALAFIGVIAVLCMTGVLFTTGLLFGSDCRPSKLAEDFTEGAGATAKLRLDSLEALLAEARSEAAQAHQSLERLVRTELRAALRSGCAGVAGAAGTAGSDGTVEAAGSDGTVGTAGSEGVAGAGWWRGSRGGGGRRGGGGTPKQKRPKQKPKGDRGRGAAVPKPALRTTAAALAAAARAGAAKEESWPNCICDPFGEFPCCSAAGWCGASADHCACSGCTDFRTTVSAADWATYREAGWRGACSAEAREAAGAPKGSTFVELRELCPACHAGSFVVPSSKDFNVEADGGVALSGASPCRLVLPPDENSTRISVPATITQIDVLSLGSKVPAIYWPRSKWGYFQSPSLQVCSRHSLFVWRHRTALLQPGDRPTVNAIDIGANTGDTPLVIGCAITGRVVAFEMLDKNFEVLRLFAQLNPALRIDAYNFAVGPKEGFVQALENKGNGQVSSFFARSGLRAVDASAFVEKTYGREFLLEVGFVKIDTEGNDARILKWLEPLIRAARPVVQVEWYVDHRQKCGADGAFSAGTLELFAAATSLDYTVVDPESLRPVELKGDCARYSVGPRDLLLLPAGEVARLEGKGVADLDGGELEAAIQSYLGSA